MGRPLKIAKAQAILTITDTDGTTEEVTISEDLLDPTDPAFGVIAGMPFIPATNVGNLVAGTTYYILKITGNSTFTVSATELSANPTYTPFDLATTTGNTVATTVGLVDSYFNNPNGSANTYSVVGGNTSIFGNQVVCQVAIGQAGTGVLYSYNNSTVVGGSGTDFANTLSANSAIQVINPVTQAVTDLGFANVVTGYVTIAVSNATAAGNFITSVGNAETLFANLPVTFDVNIGGLTAGTVYFVKDIPNTTAFTVSAELGLGNVALSDENVNGNATQDQFTLLANATANASGLSYIFADNETGFIIRQKGKQKYLVKGGTTGLIAQCLTANLANASLTPNTMNIISTNANAGTQLVQSLSDHNSELFTANSGPVASGNIDFGQSEPVFVTFNSAANANISLGIPYPIVTINGA